MENKWFRCTGDSCCGVYGIWYNAGKIWHLEGVSKSKPTATKMAELFRKEWRGTRRESNITVRQVTSKGKEKLWAVYSWRKDAGGTYKAGKKQAKVTQISRDPFGRFDIIRESVGPGKCDWCGQQKKTLYQYGVNYDDRNRDEWSRGRFCCKRCWQAYHS